MTRRLFFLILPSASLLFASLSAAQVTLISPEEGRRALKNMPPAPPAASKRAPGAQPQPATTPTARPRRGTMLPDRFGGWTAAAPAELYGPYNAASLSPSDGPVLVEYGFAGAERRRFSNNGQTMTVEAFRMKDSSGSYGLYTFYRGENWEAKDAGGERTALHGPEALVHKDEVLVRASLDSGAAFPEADLRALAAEVESKGGGPLPTLPSYLPDKGLVPKSSRYILGPRALARLVPEVPLGLVDFNLDAEVDVARYQLPGQPPANLLLLSYPTPQIAAAKIKGLGDLPLNTDSSNALIYSRRSGPLLAFVIGAADQKHANALLDRVEYSGDIIWNERVEKMDAPTFAKLILNILLLAGAWLVFALVAGLLFGAIRVLVKRRYPNQRVFDRPEESEVIRLNINYSR